MQAQNQPSANDRDLSSDAYSGEPEQFDYFRRKYAPFLRTIRSVLETCATREPFVRAPRS